MMEDLVLKLTELDIDTCWMTFTDSDKIKKALSLTTTLEVAAIVAFGYGEKTAKKLRLNILSMSQIDVRAEQQYYAPKKGVNDLVHMGSWSNKSGLDEMMDFYDDMLWQSFYAASLSPSYLNRQPYGSEPLPGSVVWMGFSCKDKLYGMFLTVHNPRQTIQIGKQKMSSFVSCKAPSEADKKSIR